MYRPRKAAPHRDDLGVSPHWTYRLTDAGWQAVGAVLAAIALVVAVASIDPWGYDVAPTGEIRPCAPIWRELPQTPICPTRMVGNEHP